MSGPTVSAGYTRALLAYAVSRGAARRTLLESCGIRDLEDADNRILIGDCAALFEAAVVLCNDPAFALHFGETVRTEDLSVAWMIAAVAGTVGEGRTQMNRYRRLIRDDEGADSELLELVRDRDGVWLAYKSNVYIETRYFVEAGFAWCIRETRKMLQAQYGDRPFLKAIHFTHGEPGYRDEYDRVFNVPLVFGSHRNAILIDNELLSVKLPSANPYVSQVLSRHAGTLLHRLENSRTIRGRVENLLLPNLGTAQAGIEAIASNLGMSRQTLFRKLKAEGVTFAQVVDELRHKMAVHYLSEKNVSVTEAAYLVGFSEPAAFSRAYKRWTGASPRTTRARTDGTK